MRGGSRQQGAGAVGADGLRLIEMRGPLNTGQLGTAPGPGPGAGVITPADCFNYCGLHNPCLPRHWSLVICSAQAPPGSNAGSARPVI